MGTVIVHPEPGFEKVIAQELLTLADSPYQVEYVMWPSPGFRVPEWLYDMWESLTHPDSATGNPAPFGHEALRGLRETEDRIQENAATVIADVITALETGRMPEGLVVENMDEVPVKRKPGRPKKNTEGQ